MKWYKKSAEQGNADAQYNLGVMYQNGYGVLKNDKTAGFWWAKSAEQGHVKAQFNLGVMYANGAGVVTSILRLIPKAIGISLDLYESVKKKPSP